MDAAVAGDADAVERMGDRELAMACQKEAYRLDPESYVARRRRAESDRNVTLRPAPDAMAWLTALLPVKDGVAAFVALTSEADSARATGDPRSKGQVMADTLVASMLAGAPNREATSGPSVELGLVMTDRALFGESDEPAHVDGFGPVPAELAREIVAGACSRDEKVWLRRLYAHPTSGQLVDMDSRARLFRNSLGRFIVLRDQVCRTPWCDAPIRHRDHAEAQAEGGPTDAENGQGLCQACNHAKQAPRWRARPSPDSSGHHVTTTTPTGHTYGSGPPALVRYHGLTIRVDYVLAG